MNRGDKQCDAPGSPNRADAHQHRWDALNPARGLQAPDRIQPPPSTGTQHRACHLSHPVPTSASEKITRSPPSLPTGPSLVWPGCGRCKGAALGRECSAVCAPPQPGEGGQSCVPGPPNFAGLPHPSLGITAQKAGRQPCGSPGTATEQPRAPAPAPLCPPQHGEMELNLFCIRLSLALRSTKRLKNNKEKAKPSAIITSL